MGVEVSSFFLLTTMVLFLRQVSDHVGFGHLDVYLSWYRERSTSSWPEKQVKELAIASLIPSTCGHILDVIVR